jgi:hypothetical protein
MRKANSMGVRSSMAICTSCLKWLIGQSVPTTKRKTIGGSDSRTGQVILTGWVTLSCSSCTHSRPTTHSYEVEIDIKRLPRNVVAETTLGFAIVHRTMSSPTVVLDNHPSSISSAKVLLNKLGERTLFLTNTNRSAKTTKGINHYICDRCDPTLGFKAAKKSL